MAAPTIGDFALACRLFTDFDLFTEIYWYIWHYLDIVMAFWHARMKFEGGFGPVVVMIRLAVSMKDR